jgi:glycosyltransferase involved in cell wall biosynthesis
MRVVAILEEDAAKGGGFNQALNAVLQMRDICEGRFDFEVLTTEESNVVVLHKLKVPAETFAFSVADKLLSSLSSNPWWHLMQIRLKLTGPFEKMLLRRGCDLVYFVTPSLRPNILQRLNFIATVWDLCHRDVPEFPEGREFARFQVYEHLYRTSLPSAFAVLTDSSALAAAASRRYGVDRERLLPMPFAPAPFLSAAASAEKPAVFAKYGLAEGYFLYPAQFWAHKNHVRILQALLLLRSRGHRPRVAFAGGDQGNRSHVERFVDAHALRDQVHLLGFVPAEDMRGLYEGCCAVVMPTYFGPTNIPPLEAWLIGKPLIYSSHFKEQAGDAALCVNPDDADELAEAMRTCTDAGIRASVVRAGTLRLRQIEQQRKEAESALLERLRQFEARRSCWP